MNTNVIESASAIGADTATEGGITIYEFRKLNATDTFLMFKILSKININDLVKGITADSVKDVVGGDTTALGMAVMMEMVGLLLTNLPKCENEIYQLLENTSNLTVAEIKALDFATFTEMVIDFVKKEEFRDFVKVVSKSFKLVK